MRFLSAIKGVFGGSCSTKSAMDEFQKARSRVEEKTSRLIDDPGVASIVSERNGFSHVAKRMRERGSGPSKRGRKGE